MMMSLSRISIFVGMLAVIILPCRAWDPDGHQIVATIAFDQLNPKAKAEVLALSPQMVGPGPAYDPVTISCWMDDLRNKENPIPYHGLFYPWHYIDFGLSPGDPQPELEPGNDNETHGNAVTALKRAMVVLQGGTDPYIKSKAMALAIATHLVGDIHQPLHGASFFYRDENGRWRDDAGGNRVSIVNGPLIEPKYNLHYFWDAAWRVGFDEKSGHMTVDIHFENWNHHNPQVVQPLAKELEISDKPAVSVSLAPDFVGWAKESNQIAREMVYPKLTFTENHKEARISAAYVAMAEPLAQKRLVLAGYRLAALLNATLGADKPGPVPASYPAGPPIDLQDETAPTSSKK